MKTIRVSALNITADKHPPNTYENLLSDILKMRMSAQIRGEIHGILGSLVKQRKDGRVVTLHGYIYKFLHIEPDGRWFNLQETKEADDSDLRAIRIPDHLKPNLKQFEFIFYVSDHRMVIQTYHDGNSLSISSISKFFGRLFGHPKIVGKYGDINVTIEVEKDKLEQLYQIPQLDKLTINVVRPNPDDLHGAEQRVFERMSNQGARKHDVVWEAERGKSIKPDEKTKELANVAASNGKVTAAGKNSEGSRIEESTIEHSLEEVEKYDPNTQQATEAFDILADQTVRKIRAWLK